MAMVEIETDVYSAICNCPARVATTKNPTKGFSVRWDVPQCGIENVCDPSESPDIVCAKLKALLIMQCKNIPRVSHDDLRITFDHYLEKAIVDDATKKGQFAIANARVIKKIKSGENTNGEIKNYARCRSARAKKAHGENSGGDRVPA